jgi:hypothetical protein
MIEKIAGQTGASIRRVCAVLGEARSSFYHAACQLSLQNQPRIIESKPATFFRCLSALEWVWQVAFGRARDLQGRCPLFPLEEGFGEPWFPISSLFQRSCTFLRLAGFGGPGGALLGALF